MDPIVPPVIEEYCTRHSSPPAPLLREIETYTLKNCTDAQMLIGPLEAAFLQLLVRSTGTRRILEIDTFTGYSALAMAEALPDDGEMSTCEVSSRHAEIARGFFARSPYGQKITLHLGPALETLQRLTTQFDFVFLDADKENYINYYERVMTLLKAGGLIVADNVLWSGRVLKPQRESDRAIVEFNDHVRHDKRVECAMVPLRDGMSLIRKR